MCDIYDPTTSKEKYLKLIILELYSDLEVLKRRKYKNQQYWWVPNKINDCRRKIVDVQNPERIQTHITKEKQLQWNQDEVTLEELKDLKTTGNKGPQMFIKPKTA